MKLLHIADLHLDRAFEGLKAIPSQVSAKLQRVNQEVLNAIINIALANQVDAVIFAGDTFHQSRTSIRTQAYFINELTRLEAADIPVIMAFGNHDYYVSQRYWFSFPKNVFLFESEQVETHYFTTKTQEKVAVSGFSYEHSWIDRSMLPEFPEKDPTVDIHLGIYHGELMTDGQQNYAPFSLSEMKSKGYDYWALGHIHQPQVVSAKPLIVFPGTPQGHTKKEQGLQGVAIVQVENSHATTHFESTAQVVWQTETYSLSSCATLEEALNYLLTSLLADNSKQSELLLKEVKLTDTAHLGEEFQLSYESGELIQFLQESVLKQTNQTIFVFQIELQNESIAKKILIPADPELLKQLEQNYLQPAIFSDAAKELIQNPLFHTIIKVDEQWRKQAIIQADQQLKEDFVIQEDHL